MTPELVLHIGAGKCGSSSLQSYLSQNSAHTSRHGHTYEYVAIGGNGKPLRGQNLKNYAAKSPYGYGCYPPIGANGKQLGIILDSATTLRAMKSEDITPILSCEGWVKECEQFTESRVLEKIGLVTDVVLYVRPPLDWINSAYWQWGAWTGAGFERWLKNAHTGVFWGDFAESWRNVPNVRHVQMRLATNDIVTDFMQRIECDLQGHAQALNSGSSGDFLRFLQRNRIYRFDPHSPQVEFIFNRLITEKSSKTPWIIEPKLQDWIFQCLGDHYKSLHNYLSPADWETVLGDSRWWDASSYVNREVEDAAAVNDIAGADRLISQLLDAIIAGDLVSGSETLATAASESPVVSQA